jgi:hypothetical protein
MIPAPTQARHPRRLAVRATRIGSRRDPTRALRGSPLLARRVGPGASALPGGARCFPAELWQARVNEVNAAQAMG